MLFRKRDKNIKEAINFVKKQKKHNEENIKQFKDFGFSTKELEEWNTMYNNIINLLKSIKN